MRLMEGYVSAHVLGHEFSFGKTGCVVGPVRAERMRIPTMPRISIRFESIVSEPLRIPLAFPSDRVVSLPVPRWFAQGAFVFPRSMGACRKN